MWDLVDNTLRGPRTWEEAHKVVLEHEAREATNKAAAVSVLTTTSTTETGGGGGSKGNNKKGANKDEKSLAAQIALLQQTVLSLQSSAKGSGGAGKKKGVCFNMRDHGSCKEGANCKWSHDPEEVKAARRALKGGDTVNVGQPAQAKAKAKPKAKGGGRTARSLRLCVLSLLRATAKRVDLAT